MRMIVVSFMLLASIAGLRAADPDAAIRDAEKAWASSAVARDFGKLDGILGNKLIYAHATGAIESKEQYLGRLRSGAQKYDKIEQESIRVVSYGDAAVSHSIARMSGTTNTKPFNDHLMILHVWIKENGAWRLAAHQTTKLVD